MHTQTPRLLANIMLQRFSASEDGMHVELLESKDSPQPLITFREDEALGMQVLLHIQDGDLAFALADLERAIEFAKLEVRKESFYG
ncbi:hypothetical protein [Pseudoduganella violaceinigra]|uniref:hypothetical protein n=1 Tax=Pseudoduganella violaceinigra TaxID=246602 RepID=UPI00047F7831|nr:hypothetical protein [Pseudoduganella violaceinigra]